MTELPQKKSERTHLNTFMNLLRWVRHFYKKSWKYWDESWKRHERAEMNYDLTHLKKVMNVLRCHECVEMSQFWLFWDESVMTYEHRSNSSVCLSTVWVQSQIVVSLHDDALKSLSLASAGTYMKHHVCFNSHTWMCASHIWNTHH